MMHELMKIQIKTLFFDSIKTVSVDGYLVSDRKGEELNWIFRSKEARCSRFISKVTHTQNRLI